MTKSADIFTRALTSQGILPVAKSNAQSIDAMLEELTPVRNDWLVGRQGDDQTIMINKEHVFKTPREGNINFIMLCSAPNLLNEFREALFQIHDHNYAAALLDLKNNNTDYLLKKIAGMTMSLWRSSSGDLGLSAAGYGEFITTVNDNKQVAQGQLECLRDLVDFCRTFLDLFNDLKDGRALTIEQEEYIVRKYLDKTSQFRFQYSQLFESSVV